MGADYPVGIKINSADFQRGGFTEEESMKVIQLLGNEGMDLIEISGGTYERPAMIKGNRKKKYRRTRSLFFGVHRKSKKVNQNPSITYRRF